jgi:hypothetical protein
MPSCFENSWFAITYIIVALRVNLLNVFIYLTAYLGDGPQSMEHRDIIDMLNETRRERILKLLTPLLFVGIIVGVLIMLERFI